MSALPPKLDPGQDEGPLKFRSESGESALVAEEAVAAIECISRKIEDLARELNRLGYFDDDDDRPRAA